MVPSSRVPAHAGPGTKVRRVGHANFIPVVETGNAGIGELDDGSQPLEGIVLFDDGTEPGCIVAVEEVELLQGHGPGDGRPDGLPTRS